MITPELKQIIKEMLSENPIRNEGIFLQVANIPELSVGQIRSIAME